MFNATMIADSVSPQGKRLCSVKVRHPRMIHSEFLRHRSFSFSASGSRAVPIKKLLEEVRSDDLRAEPIHWGANQKGMTADRETDALVPMNAVFFPTRGMLAVTTLKKYYGGMGFDVISDLQITGREAWREAAMRAADVAEAFDRAGYHKQLVNRILEPFSHVNVLVTGTEWNNFFGLRLHHAAQPEMRYMAKLIWDAFKFSTPRNLKPGQWHRPYVEESDENHALAIYDGVIQLPDDHPYRTKLIPFEDILTAISVARCARVSYESFETGKRSTVEEDLALYDKLVGSMPLHASPAEHQATPDELTSHEGKLHVRYGKNFPMMEGRRVQYFDWEHQDQHGNLVGWRQYRKMLPGEAVAPLPEGLTPCD